jgi:hypothetical protein
MPYDPNAGPDNCWGVDDGGDCEHCGRSLDNYCDCPRCDRCGYVVPEDCDCARCEADGCGVLLDEMNDTGFCPEHQEPECVEAAVEAWESEGGK